MIDSFSQGQASDEIEGLSIETPYIVALPSNGGWFVSYKNLEGDVKWKFIYFREAQNTQMWNGDGEKQCMIHLFNSHLPLAVSYASPY